MSRVNTVHGLYDHDLRGHVRASRKTPKGIILGVFFDGEFYSESSVTAVKLSVRKGSLIKRVGGKIHGTTVRSWDRKTVVSLTNREVMRNSVSSGYLEKKFMRGGWS